MLFMNTLLLIANLGIISSIFVFCEKQYYTIQPQVYNGKNIPNIFFDALREKRPKRVVKWNEFYEQNFSNTSNSEQKNQPKDKTIKHFNINTPKSLNAQMDNVSLGRTDQKSKLIYYYNTENEKERSTSDLINSIHHARGTFSQKNRNNKTYLDFPENWYRILEDGKRKINEYILFYEVPLLDAGKKDLNTMELDNNKKLDFSNTPRKAKMESDDEDEFLFVPELSSDVDSDDDGGVSERFLNLFQVVKFFNKDCYSSNGVKGVCLHPIECQTTSGVSSGSCAEGYGICCVYQNTCGDETSSNCSTFTSPNFPKPSTGRLSCTLTVHKAYPEVTQLRLDIVQLELRPPTNGTCVEDQFVVTGQNTNNAIPILCGINNDQHTMKPMRNVKYKNNNIKIQWYTVYVDVGDASGPFYISVMTSRAAERLVQVRVCQLGPGDETAPQGCLQYHRSAMGVIESFNYRTEGSIPGYREPGYTNNLNYAVCIARESNRCTITYSNYDENGDFDFQISNYDSDGVPILPPGQAGVEIFNCPDDFIVVNGIRLCGERLNDASLTEDFTLNAPVTETGAGPIVFTFRTNGNVTGHGFKLHYRQNPCSVYG